MMTRMRMRLTLMLVSATALATGYGLAWPQHGDLLDLCVTRPSPDNMGVHVAVHDVRRRIVDGGRVH